MRRTYRHFIHLLLFGLIFIFLPGCSPQTILPTRAAAVIMPAVVEIPQVPPTFTPAAPGATIDPRLNHNQGVPLRPTLTPSITPIIPTSTSSPTPTFTPTPTYTPSPIPPTSIAGSGAGYPYRYITNPNKTRLSLHIIRPNDANIMEFVRQTRPTVIKLVDDFGLSEEIKQVSPNTIIVGRVNDNNQQYQGIPEEEARKYVADKLNKYRANPYIDYWEGWNEPDPGLQNMGWYARFEQERVREMARQGLKSAIGGFATGVPELDEFALFLPAIETAIQYGAVLTLHEYSAPVMTYGYGSALPGYPSYPDRGILTLRYRWYYRELLEPRNLVIPLIITEAGIDGIIGDRPGPRGLGWADFQAYAVEQGWGSNGIEAFVNQLAWYDSEVRKDYYVLGFTVFTAGSIGHWRNYEIAPVLPRLIDYGRGQQ